jgi:protein-S-isoprenylcysteine O-methyltransferase Ste14
VLALAIWIAHPLAIFAPFLFVAYITRFQIMPEERVLRQKFGAEFDAYARDVPRWVFV